MSSGKSWKKQREDKGLRKVELAKKAGLSITTIVRLESGDPSISEVTKSKVRIALARP